MWLFPVIVTATLLPALTVLIFYLLTLARRVDDPEIKARRRWRMMSRGNVVWAMGIVAGLIAIAEAPVPGFGPAARAAVSVFFVVIAFCPLAITLGIIDKRIRGIDYPLVGYMKLQYSLFFCRWTSFLVVIVIMYVFLNTVNRQVWVSSAAIALAAGGAVLFVAVTLFQMRLVGRVTGLLSPVNPDEEPARTVRELAARAGVRGVRVSVMETFGYPFYNAFAAPGKTVYITRPVLSALTPEEVSAIAAHEIGHLATMRQRTALMLTLLTAVVVGLWFLIPGLGWILSDIGSFIVEIAVTLAILAIGIVALGAVSRRYETRADATATELMGGPQPVISALEKIYDLGMLPRRFDKKGSENASHPSLERRIAQIRGEKLPAPKRKVRVLLIIALCALILICLKLLSYFGEGSIGSDYPRSSYGDAVTTLEERLAEDPNDFDALKRLANEYYFLGEDGLALETIDRALAVNRDPGLLLLKGVILEWAGDLAGALAAVEDALGAGAGPQALRWAAALAVELGDMKEAHDYLSALRAIYPGDPYAEKMERYLSGDGGEYPFPDYYIVFQGTGR